MTIIRMHFANRCLFKFLFVILAQLFALTSNARLSWPLLAFEQALTPYLSMVSTGMGDHIWVQFPVPDILSRYVTRGFQDQDQDSEVPAWPFLRG